MQNNSLPPGKRSAPRVGRATRAASGVGVCAIAALLLIAATPTYTPVTPTTPITLPRDHGAHPGFRTEWWYATGWLSTETGEKLGFQLTFFRTATGADPANPSRFNPGQILRSEERRVGKEC